MMLSSIQALRFFAALLVLFFHLGLMNSGYKGVDLFFVISGFVLYYQYRQYSVFDKKVRRKYFVNRFTKIYLLYWTSLIALYAAAPFPLHRSLIGTILLLPGHVPVHDVSWSLSYEIYFYICMGLTIFYLPFPWHKPIFVATFIFSTLTILYSAFIHPLNKTILHMAIGINSWQFLAGALACMVFRTIPVTAKKVPFASLSLILLLLLVKAAFGYDIHYNHFVYGSLAFLLLITLPTAERTGLWDGRWKRIVITAGNASYAMYLFGPIIWLFIPGSSLSSRIFSILATIVLSILIHLFFEDKLLRRVRRLLSAESKKAVLLDGPLPTKN